MTLQELAHERSCLRDRKKLLEAEEKQVSSQIEYIDQQLFALLDEQGTNLIRADGVTISISEKVVPSVLDWSAVYQYVQSTGNFQLFERRMASTAFRELIDQGIEIPGTEKFTRRTINMRVA